MPGDTRGAVAREVQSRCRGGWQGCERLWREDGVEPTDRHGRWTPAPNRQVHESPRGRDRLSDPLRSG